MGKNKESGQVNGFIDRGCSFEGKLMFDGTVQINGDFRGEVLSDGTLVVGSDANLNARVQVDTIVIEGAVQGLIEAKTKIELRNGSRLVANIITPSLVIEDGALFQGQCQMMSERKTEEEVVPRTADNISVEEGGDSLMM